MKKFVLILFTLLFGGFIMSFAAKTNAQEDLGGLGLKMDGGCLTGVGSGCFSVDKFLFPDSPIVQLNERRTVKTLTQDFMFGALYIVGAVLVVVIIYCGLMYIFAARSGGETSTYKDGLVKAAIGSLLVWGAYTIVRIIQYMARG